MALNIKSMVRSLKKQQASAQAQADRLGQAISALEGTTGGIAPIPLREGGRKKTAKKRRKWTAAQKKAQSKKLKAAHAKRKKAAKGKK